MITADQTVGHIAKNFPMSTRVFGRYKIDFCCKGRLSLQEVCGTHDIEIDKLVADIEAEIELAPPTALDGWADRSTPELVAHILENYHRPLDEELPRLESLADKVARVHGDRDRRLPRIAQTFTLLRAELEEHFRKEENVLFPAILADDGQPLAGPIRVMLQDHEDAGDMLVLLRELADDFQVPPHACNSWRALLGGLEDLERSLHEHIHLENNILFPRAAA
ncbi:iron-sulfur cluster repair di-iron protein [Lujinxingia vulgaris]|uniref:Iron-sulfur cluster repair di-iron protein n=1 Tax=Lujinxingia vulgaris TaxID=2600176 RepID=A0A5C6X9R0_9DELT|nr:iron-sulfur cluster repair di-iron protein [Lujinxingia vulgaris]TXD37126.1 iron-sulfur cluster repair di-iron protein [Lujinxingia vulgaris]